MILEGCAKKNQKVSLVSTAGENTNKLASTIQHELSHNLGADHETCIAKSSNQKCIVADEDDLGFWCDACEAAIKNNY